MGNLVLPHSCTSFDHYANRKPLRCLTFAGSLLTVLKMGVVVGRSWW